MAANSPSRQKPLESAHILMFSGAQQGRGETTPAAAGWTPLPHSSGGDRSVGTRRGRYQMHHAIVMIPEIAQKVRQHGGGLRLRIV